MDDTTSLPRGSGRSGTCRLVMGLLVLSGSALLPDGVAAQLPIRRLFVIGSDDGSELPDVRAAAHAGAGTVVLSTPGPAVHLRSPNGVVRGWGRSGEGPGEFRDPVDMAWSGGGGVVLDQAMHRLTGIRDGGQVVRTRSLGTAWANRVRVVRGDTLLQLFEPMSSRRAVVRLRAGGVDTLFVYQMGGAELRLAPGTGPSLTIRQPYAPTLQWSDLPEIGVAFWQPGSDAVVVREVSGRIVARLPIPTDRLPVAPDDRQWWLDHAIPSGFRGRDIFAGAKELAARSARFPVELPAILAILGTPEGQVWVRRTSAGTGERWDRLGSDSGRQTFRLPQGRELLALGGGVALVRARTELDEPVVEAWSIR